MTSAAGMPLPALNSSSDASSAALDWAIGEAVLHGAALEIVHAWSPSITTSQEGVPRQEDPGAAEARAKTAPEAIVAKKDDRPRIGALSAFVFIYPHPAYEGLAIGSVRIGTTVALKSKDPVPGKGCGRGWLAVEPRGFVCPNLLPNLESFQHFHQRATPDHGE